MMRMASSEGNIPGDRLRNGCFEDEDWPKFDKAVRVMKGNNLIIDDRPALTPQQVRAKALKVKRQHGRINVIMVDYMQLMTINGRSEGRTNEITKISGSLKALAKELDCPVIALAQLNRDLEKRPNKRPMMSDLRESGAIEQDADIIMFLYRDEVYNENSEYKGICECIFGKFRQGETGTEFLKSELHYSRFLNLLNWTKPEDKPLESSGFTYKK
jgi:replicative DNA helicase